MMTMQALHGSGAVLRIGLISYDHAHLKTEQLLHRLLLKNVLSVGPRLDGPRLDVKLLALPFSPRPARKILFAHRPDQENSVSTRELANRHRLDFMPCTYDSIPDVADIYLVAGAGILAASAIGQKKIFNVHPGIIPSARGLDAFKWSIFDGLPLGVTLHAIDAEVDAGEAIAIVKTPIFPGDSLDSLARRHYELELDVLAEFSSLLDGAAKAGLETFPENLPRMRMPIDTEREMIAKFDEYKRRFSGSTEPALSRLL
jgi:phosphoribosylglycinamide formyltransferase 1